MFYILSARKNNPTILKEKQNKKFPKNSWKANHLCDKVNAVDIILLSERELELTISFVLQVWRPDNELKVSGQWASIFPSLYHRWGYFLLYPVKICQSVSGKLQSFYFFSDCSDHRHLYHANYCIKSLSLDDDHKHLLGWFTFMYLCLSIHIDRISKNMQS